MKTRWLLVLIMVLGFTSCQVSNSSRKQRDVEKRMEQMKSQEQDDIKNKKQKHWSQQSERSKEMMKQARKNNRKINRKRQKESIWQRIFGTRSGRLRCS